MYIELGGECIFDVCCLVCSKSCRANGQEGTSIHLTTNWFCKLKKTVINQCTMQPIKKEVWGSTNECRTGPSLKSSCQMCLPHVIIIYKANNPLALRLISHVVGYVMSVTNSVNFTVPYTRLHMCHFPPSEWAQSHAEGSSSGFHCLAVERHSWYLDPKTPLQLFGLINSVVGDLIK